MDIVFRVRLRRHPKMPDLIDWISTNTTVIADSASMDFPLASASGCLVYVFHRKRSFSVVKNLFFQSAQTFEDIYISRARLDRVQILIGLDASFQLDHFCTQ